MQTAWLTTPPTNAMAIAAIATGVLTGKHCIYDCPIQNLRWTMKNGEVDAYKKDSVISWKPWSLRADEDDGPMKVVCSFDPND